MSLQEMLLHKIDLDICSGEIATQIARRERIERDLKHGAEREATVRDEIQGRENLIADLKNALAANDSYALRGRMLREKESLERSVEADRKEVDRAALLRKQVESLLGRKIAADLGAEIKSCKSAREDRMGKRVRAELVTASLGQPIAEKKAELGELSRGILRHPESTVRLLDSLRKKGVDASVFCDLLDITDEIWQNAVEGWLNTQRFNILVGENDFQKALEIYNSLPRDVYGVGLPDLGKMMPSTS